MSTKQYLWHWQAIAAQDSSIEWRRFRLWWRRHDRRNHLLWRTGNAVAALLIIFSIAIPLMQQAYQTDRYSLASSSIKLVGDTNKSLEKLLTYDGLGQQYQFNKDAVTNSQLPAQLQKTTVGTPASKKDSTYALDIAQDFSRGVTYHDVNSQLSFSLQPEFSAMTGKQVDGHIVFPLNSGNQAVYTLKGNGLKEDIVMPQVSSDTMTFNYKLNLPNTLEAKVIPNSNGAIGIYSADPALFGNISYGSSEDQARVEKARANGEKNYLVFGLPSPVIKLANGQVPEQATARFVLNGDQLGVVAEHLGGVKGPISIDPSVVVSSASDFSTAANNEGNISFGGSGGVSRGGLTGGSVGGWGSGTALSSSNAAARQATVAYNGYLYMLGGVDTSISTINRIQYTPINSGGSAMGAWNSAGTLPTGRYGLSAVAYNGYMYILGGTSNNGTSGLNDVEYTQIKSDGTLDTAKWKTANTIANNVFYLGAAAYNGYLYALGGTTNSTSPVTTVQYAQINADGSLGSWNSTSSLSGTGRYSFATAVYNGYLYMMGGRDAGTLYNDVQYAQLNSDGSLGSWQTTTSFSGIRYSLGATVYSGYLYIMGGNSNQTDVQYAPIYANGTVGTWKTTNTIVGRSTPGTVAYGGYLYVIGGAGSSGTLTTNSVQYAQIDPAGQAQAWTTDSTHTISARALTCSVAYNSFLYAIGGSTTDDSTGSTVAQVSAISSSGTLGTWNTATTLTTARSAAGCAASNGFFYLVGGYGGGVDDGAVLYATIASGGTLGTFNSATHTIVSDDVVTPINPGVFISGGYIYSVGGDGSNPRGNNNGVYAAPLSSSGDITSAWVPQHSLPNSYTGQAFAMVGNYLYAFGGNTGSGVSSAVAYAQILSDGTVSTWASTTAMPGGISNARGATVNGCIYSIGGKDGSGTSQNAVYYTCPNSDGTISGWNTAPSLVTATSDIGVASAGGSIFGVGGWTTTAIGNVAFAAVNNGGSGTTAAAAWVTNTATLLPTSPGGNNTGVAYGQFFAANGYLYLVGGYDGTTTRNTVWSVAINNDGSIGSGWAQQSQTMNTPRYQFGMTIANGYVYVFAGENGGTPLNTYEYAKIGTGGTLSTLWTQGTITDSSGSTITTRLLPDAASYGGYVYFSGGQNGSTRYNDVYGASINASTGALTWLTGSALNGYTTGRSEHKSFAYNGYLYVLGGNSGTAPLNDVQYAAINTSDGTLGSWRYTTPLQQPRRLHSLGVANGFVYVLGGTNSVGNLTDVEDAPILANGALGVWERSAGSFTNSRSNAQATIYNGILYLGGGFKSTASPPYLSDIQYISLNASPRIGHYSKLIDFGTAVSVNSVSYGGTAPATTTNPNPIQVRAAGTSLVNFGSSIDSTSVGQSAPSCTQPGISNTRYLWVFVTFDDSQSSILADANGSNGNLANLTITYTPAHPLPNARLRGGQMLQNGNLTGLDTCGA